MKNLTVAISLILLSILITSTVACSSGGGVNTGSLTITGMQTSISQVSGNTQTLNYSVTLRNQSNNAVFVETAEPEIVPGFASRVLVDNLIKQVDRNLVPGGNIEVAGSFTFDSTGLTKQDIENFRPYLTGLRIINEETLRITGK